MGTLLLSSAALTSLFIFLFLFFLFLFFSNNILHKMENENNFNVIKEELENIASGLRRLINSDESLNVAVDSQSESRIDATASAASSTSGVGLRRLLKRISREASENRASNASSTDKLDWRPLLDSVENLNAASLSDFDLKRLFAEGKNAKAIASSLSHLYIERLFKEGKDATTSVNDLELRRLFEECGKATPESLSNLCINRLFSRNDDSKSLSNLCVDRLFKREEPDENAKQEISLIDLGTRRLFQEEKPAAASLSDLGMAQLFQPSTHDQTTTDQASGGTEASDAADTSSNAWTTEVIVSLRELIEAKLRLLLQSKADTEVDISAPAGIESTTPTVGAPVRRKLVAKRRIVRRKEDLNGKGDNAKEEMDAGEKERSKVDAGDDHNKVESGDPKEAVDEGSEDDKQSKNQKEKSKGDEEKVEEKGESGDEEAAGAEEKRERSGEKRMKDQDPTNQDEESSISEEEMEVDDVDEADGEESDDEEEESEKDNVVSEDEAVQSKDDAKGDHVEEKEGKY